MACLIFKVSQTCYRYKARLDEENQQIAEWLIQLTNDHKTWGFKLCFLYLRNVKKYKWNHKLVGQYITFLEYPDGTVAIMHEGRKISYSIFNKLARLQQNEVVENKRLGAVLAHIQQQHEELEKQNKCSRSKKSTPSHKAQKVVIEQRNLNPVLDSCS